jgi:membrane protease YdiL (CAAX protease family)
VRREEVLDRWRKVRRDLEGWLPMPITHVVAAEQRESADVVARRRKVVAATAVTGATLLGVS